MTRTTERAAPALSVLRWLAAALVAAYLLFAHGCHGDEDNELFARLTNRTHRVTPRLDEPGAPTTPSNSPDEPVPQRPRRRS